MVKRSLRCSRSQKAHLSAEETAKDFLHNVRVEFDELGQDGEHLLLAQTVQDRNEEPHVRHPLLIQVTNVSDEGGTWWIYQKGTQMGIIFGPFDPTTLGLHLSVRMWMMRMSSVSAPFGQVSTSFSSSGESMPIPSMGVSTIRRIFRFTSAFA